MNLLSIFYKLISLTVIDTCVASTTFSDSGVDTTYGVDSKAKKNSFVDEICIDMIVPL
jgi:hypothetical protein